ncbi:hypothetical protein GCM10010191_53090 [Actinomadura vinacea]|uniref:Protein kinase domain-containing protein n=1 Tax=Actinomadura vinacea TaxID=115336 RepID=A0ABN3JJQ4_9ACTN
MTEPSQPIPPDPVPPGQGAVRYYRAPLGDVFGAEVVELDAPADPAPPPLRASRVELVLEADGDVREARRLSCAASPGRRAGASGDDDRAPLAPAPANGTANGTAGTAFAMLDNEILAGVRLARLNANGPYPAEVTELIGYEADSASPVAFLEPPRGEPVGRHAGRMLLAQHKNFQTSLLKGVLQLTGAGIAHRRIGPDTVYWDGSTAQVTDFSQAALIGTARTVTGEPPWQAPEQRPGRVAGTVGDRDDLWAAGRLIFYVVTGRELRSAAQLEEHPELARRLAGVFARAERRPPVAEVLERFGGTAPIRLLGPDPEFEAGRKRFTDQRRSKHPGAVPPEPSEPEAEPEAKPPPPPSPEKEPAANGSRPGGAAVLLWLAAAALLLVTGYLAFGR